MHLRSLCTLLFVLAFAFAGCRTSGKTSSLAASQRDAAQADDRIAKLESQIESLKLDNRLLSARLEEQYSRENRLSAELSRLKFRNAKLAEQIEILAVVPAQRDSYKARCEQLSVEIAGLKKQLAELTKTIDTQRRNPPAPSTRTSSAGTGSPEPGTGDQ
jgi:chromosome segregation ATPase